MKRKTSTEAWHSRGYLPYFDQSNLIQSITFPLNDAIPKMAIEYWKKELAWSKRMPASDPRQIELGKRIDKYEDAGHGACWLLNNFDRYIRDEMHLTAAIDYIENNPVKAWLVASREKWPWSSAWKHGY